MRRTIKTTFIKKYLLNLFLLEWKLTSSQDLARDKIIFVEEK